jgi:membrane protein implicated in regulation of membrane protease activity
VTYFLTYWLFLSQIWLIFGLVLILLELTDGSAIFYLPMGLGAFVISVTIYAVNNDYLPAGVLPTAWYWLLAMWISIAVIISVTMSAIKKRKSADPDINEY